MAKSYKTNLQVSEAGAPINIGNVSYKGEKASGEEFFSKPFKDM